VNLFHWEPQTSVRDGVCAAHPSLLQELWQDLRKVSF